MGYNKIIAILLLLGVSMGACTNNLIGLYDYKGNANSPDKLKLIINTDSSFRFEGWNDIVGESIITGKWFKKKDTLYLVIADNNSSACIVKEKQDKSIDGKRIKVLDNSDHAPVFGVYLTINGEKYMTDIDGQILINDKEINQITLSYLNHIEDIRISNCENNDIEVLLNFNNFEKTTLYLSPKWLVKPGKLLCIDERNNAIKNEVFIKK